MRCVRPGVLIDTWEDDATGCWGDKWRLTDPWQQIQQAVGGPVERRHWSRTQASTRACTPQIEMHSVCVPNPSAQTATYSSAINIRVVNSSAQEEAARRMRHTAESPSE